MSRIITGKLPLDIQPVALITVIEAAIDAVRPAAEAKQIQLQVSAAPQLGWLNGDPDRLQQVAWNLLSNAVKFTPEGGRVEVRLERAGAVAQIQVRDTGRGISPKFLPYVFDRFRQADASTTRTQGGLGLGLAIVRHLVELHGGTVEAESGGREQGATFTVTLPLAGAPTAPAQGEETATGEKETGRQRGRGCPPALDALRVLVVDDERDTLEFLSAVLDGCGADVTVATSAAAARAVSDPV
ncbi:MAG: ATP-binding response regulator, partial [Pyrinomonadaceae bacterium]